MANGIDGLFGGLMEDVVQGAGGDQRADAQGDADDHQGHARGVLGEIAEA